LPGAVDITATPSRLYGSVQARIRPAAKPPTPAPTLVHPVSEPVKLPSHEEVAQARVEAADLASAGRFTQSAELLSDLAEPALLALGDDDPEVLALRLDLAEVLYQGGDYRRAIPAYRVATIGLAEWFGPDDGKVLHCREQAAVCYAQLGETGEAIRLLGALLVDIADPYDDMSLRVRERMGRLRLAAGQTVQGRQELLDLLGDIQDAYGDDHPQVAGLLELLSG
jgi:tetratricopeptide (TPR) repeat protein